VETREDEGGGNIIRLNKTAKTTKAETQARRGNAGCRHQQNYQKNRGHKEHNVIGLPKTAKRTEVGRRKRQKRMQEEVSQGAEPN